LHNSPRIIPEQDLPLSMLREQSERLRGFLIHRLTPSARPVSSSPPKSPSSRSFQRRTLPRQILQKSQTTTCGKVRIGILARVTLHADVHFLCSYGRFGGLTRWQSWRSPEADIIYRDSPPTMSRRRRYSPARKSCLHLRGVSAVWFRWGKSGLQVVMKAFRLTLRHRTRDWTASSGRPSH
jgi:hypothetical protein